VRQVAVAAKLLSSRGQIRFSLLHAALHILPSGGNSRRLARILCSLLRGSLSMVKRRGRTRFDLCGLPTELRRSPRFLPEITRLLFCQTSQCFVKFVGGLNQRAIGHCLRAF